MKVAAAILGFLSPLFLGLSGASAAQDVSSFNVIVNGRSATTSSDAYPAQLYPTKPTDVRITVSAGSSTLRIATVRIEGEVMDLPLYSYDSTVDLAVPAHGTKSLAFPVSMNGIGNEATGLVVASVTLLSPNGGPIATRSVVTKVHGSITSLYGLFGLAVLALTVSSLFFALLAMARQQLSQNRWARAVRFLIPGFGVGLVLIFTMSVLDVFDPGPGHWLPLLIIASAVGLAFGYLTPAPEEEEFDDYDPNVLIAQIMVVDDDPLDEKKEEEDRSLDLVTSGAVVRRTGGTNIAPDSRSTAAPDSRATAAPDSRATAAPDSRSTTAPDSRAPNAP